MNSEKIKKENAFLFLAFLAGLVLAAYSPCLHAQFLRWDDYRHYISNPCVYSLSWYNLCNIFRQTVNDTYIPLTTLSFNLEYHLFGVSAFASHLINILLHAGIVMLVFDFARRLGFSLKEAWLAAAIFGLHPMHVESVAWVAERKDTLSILFYMLCLRAYWMYLDRQSGKQYALSLLFAFLSILAKAMAVSIPWVLLLLDWFHRRKAGKAVFLDKLPFAALVFPVALVTFLQLSPHPDIEPRSLLIGLWTFAWYLKKFFLPDYFTLTYSPALPVTLSNPAYILSLVIVVVFIFLLWGWRKNRLWVFAALFWAASIFFFWRFDFNDSNIVADRFMYLPSLGFCLLLGRCLSRFKVVPVVVVVVLGAMTFNQCRIWRDDLSLWTWALVHDPRNAVAKSNQEGAVYERSKKLPDFRCLTKAIDRDPSAAKGYFIRGVALLGEGDYFLAFSDFNRAISLNPSDGMAYVMRGELYAGKGKNDKALDDFDTAIALKTRGALAYVQKAALLKGMHHFQKALFWFGRAVEADPSFGVTFYERGILYMMLRQYNKAIDDFTHSIALHNDLKKSYCRRAEAYQALGQWPQAQQDFKMSLRQDPYDVKVLNELGIAYLMAGDQQAALDVFNQTVAMHPFYDDAYANRGIIELRRGQYALALQDYTKAISLELYPYHALITRGDIYLALGEKSLALKDYSLAAAFIKGPSLAQEKQDQLKKFLDN
ncbi:MAG: tetratricopeptide repeat protein [Candidatus Omnitrophica bacterium]|nr:tetratricopeptide repeat protein [Candidatus Omnitrophota bacterium]